MKSLKLTLTYLAAGLTALSPVAMAAPQQASKQEVNDYLSQYVTGSNKTFNDLYSKNHSQFDQRSRSLIETWLEKYGNEKAPQIKATTIRDDKGQERLQITMTVSGETVTIAESNDPGYIMVNGQKINMEQTRDITGLFNELGKNNPDYKQMAAQLDQTTVPMTVHDGGLSAEQFVRLNPEQKVQYLMLLRKQMEAVEKVLNASAQVNARLFNSDKVYAYNNNEIVFKGSVWDLFRSASAHAKGESTDDLDSISNTQDPPAATSPQIVPDKPKAIIPPVMSPSADDKSNTARTTLPKSKMQNKKGAVIETDFSVPAVDPLGLGQTENASSYFGVDRAPAAVSKINLDWPVGRSCIVAGNIGIIKQSSGNKKCNPIVSIQDQELANQQKDPPIPKDVLANNKNCASKNNNSSFIACNPIVYGYSEKDELFCVDSKIKNFSTRATTMCNEKSDLSENCPAAEASMNLPGEQQRIYTPQCISQFRKILESYSKHNNKGADISSCFGKDEGDSVAAKDKHKKDKVLNTKACTDLFSAHMKAYNDLKARAKSVCAASNYISEFPGQPQACAALEKRVLALELYADAVSPVDGGKLNCKFGSTQRVDKCICKNGGYYDPNVEQNGNPCGDTAGGKTGKKKFCADKSTGIKSFLCEPKFWAGVGIGIGASVLACKTHLFGLCRKKTRTVTNTITNTIYVPTPVTPPATEGGSGTGGGTSGGVKGSQ